MKGWVYVISNKAMPGLVKVGHTLKDPELRAKELNNTGAPHPYVVDYEVLVDEPRIVEQKAHTALKATREAKEWFRCTAEEATATIKIVIGSTIHTENHKHVDRQRSEQIERGRREAERKKSFALELRNKRINELKDKRKQISRKYSSELDSMIPDISYWGTVGVVTVVIGMSISFMTGTTDNVIFIPSATIALLVSPFIIGYLKNKEKEKHEYQEILKKQMRKIAAIDEEISRMELSTNQPHAVSRPVKDIPERCRNPV